MTSLDSSDPRGHGLMLYAVQAVLSCGESGYVCGSSCLVLDVASQCGHHMAVLLTSITMTDRAAPNFLAWQAPSSTTLIPRLPHSSHNVSFLSCLPKIRPKEVVMEK